MKRNRTQIAEIITSNKNDEFTSMKSQYESSGECKKREKLKVPRAHYCTKLKQEVSGDPVVSSCLTCVTATGRCTWMSSLNRISVSSRSSKADFCVKK